MLTHFCQPADAARSSVSTTRATRKLLNIFALSTLPQTVLLHVPVTPGKLYGRWLRMAADLVQPLIMESGSVGAPRSRFAYLPRERPRRTRSRGQGPSMAAHSPYPDLLISPERPLRRTRSRGQGPSMAYPGPPSPSPNSFFSPSATSDKCVIPDLAVIGESGSEPQRRWGKGGKEGQFVSSPYSLQMLLLCSFLLELCFFWPPLSVCET